MKLKILYSLLAVFFLSGVNLYSQERKHEIELGIGIWNLNEIINTATDIIVSTIPNDAVMEDGNSLASIHVGYKYRVANRFGVGGLFAFDYATSNAVYADDKIGDFKKIHYTLAAEADFIYLNFEKFKMYALAGVGVTMYNLNFKAGDAIYKDDSKSLFYPTFQLSPVGIKYGERFGGFLELGFGYRGILNVGMFYRL